MRLRNFKIAATVIAAVCLAVAAQAIHFTWIGQGADDDFDTAQNWAAVTIPTPPYPDGTDDNALFPWKASGGWPCNLINESIGDITIRGSVDFDTAFGTVTLSATSLKIEPTSGDVEITMNGTAQITVP